MTQSELPEFELDISSLQLIQSVINNTTDWVHVKDTNYRYQLINETAAREGPGLAVEDIIGKDEIELGARPELVHGDPERGIAGTRAGDRAVLERGEEIYVPHNRVLFRDGSEHILETHKRPLRNENGEIVGILSTSHDVTKEYQAQERQRMAFDIAQQIAAQRDVDEMLRLTVQQLSETFGYYHAHIYLLDESGENLIVREGLGEAGRLMKEAGHSISIDAPRSLVARAARAQEVVMVEDVKQEVDHLPNPLLPWTRAEMAMPLTANDELIGVLDAQQREAGAFSREELVTVAIIVSQLATAIANARLFRDIAAREAELAEQQEFLRQIINASPDWIYTKDTNFRYGIVNEVAAREYARSTPEKITGKDDYDLGASEAMVEGDPEQGIAGIRPGDRKVLEEGETVHIPRNFVFYPDGSEHVLDTRKLPLRNADGEIFSMLALSRDITEQYRTQQRQELAYSLGQQMNTMVDVDELLKLAIEELSQSFGYYHAHVYLLDESGKNLVVQEGLGEAGRQMKEAGHSISLDAEQSLVARAARTLEPVIVNDVNENPDHLPNPLIPLTQSEAAVPLVVNDQLLGVLDAQHEQSGAFDEDEITTLSMITNQLATAVYSAGLVAEAAEHEAEMAEQQRLLRQIIDTSPDWIFAKDKDYRYLVVNEAFAYEYGRLTPDEMVGKDDYDLGTPPELIEGDPEQGIVGFRTDDHAVVVEQQTLHNPNDVVNFRDGTLHIFDTTKVPLRDESGEVFGVLGLSRDVTEQIRDRQRQELAYSLGQEMNTMVDVNELLKLAVNELSQTFGYYHAHIYLLDESGKNLVVQEGLGEAGRQMKEAGHSIPLNAEQSLVARAARTLEPVIVDDVNENPDHLTNPLLPDTQSEAAVPLVVNNQLLGVLDAQQAEVNAFTGGELQTLLTMTAQLGTAVYNAQLFEDVAQREAEIAEQQQLLRQIINATPDWIYTKDTNFRYGIVNEAAAREYARSTPEKITGKDDYDLGASEAMVEGDPEQGIVGIRPGDRKVLEEGETVHIPNNFAIYPDGSEHILDTRKLPLRNANGEIFSMLALSRDITEQYRAQQRQGLAYSLGQQMNTVLDVNELLKLAIEELSQSFGYYHAHIYLLDESGKNLVVQEGLGEAGRQMKEAGHSISLDAEQSLVARAARTLEPVIVDDVNEDPNHLTNPLIPLTQSEAAVPLVVNNQLLGVLDAQHEQIGAFDEDEITTLSMITNQLATAVYNAQLFEDVAQRETEIAEQQRLLRQIIDTSPDWIFAKDKDYRYLVVNEAFAYEYGRLTPDEMVGKDDYDLGTPPELIEGDPEQGIVGFRHDDRAVVVEQQTLHNPNDVVNFRDGTRHIFDTTKVPLRSEEGEVFGVLGLSRDVTDQMRAQQRQQLAYTLGQQMNTMLDVNELLKLTVEQLSQSFGYYHAHIYLLDSSGQSLIVREGLGEAGRQMREAGHRIPLSAERSLVATAARSEESVVVNNVASRPDHLPNPMLPFTLSEAAVPLIVNQKVLGVLDVQHRVTNAFDDAEISMLRIIANQLAIAVENAALYQEQLSTAERLREVDNLKSEFLANMSHELRTPLNSIIGYSELLVDEVGPELDEMALEDLKTIHSSGHHLLAIINDILDLAKIEAARMELAISPIYLPSFVPPIVESTRILLKDKSVELLAEIPENMPDLNADPVRVRQILWNLLSNAAKFTDEGHIRLACEQDEDWLVFYVEDTGIGIPEDQQQLVFDEFRQVDGSATRKQGGTGLGLTITRQLIWLHGGDIELDSESGRGTTFIVRMPIAGPSGEELEENPRYAAVSAD